MTAHGHIRGHHVTHDPTLGWVDDRGTHGDDLMTQSCAACGLHPTPEGHDGCLGELPGVESACCGHGGRQNATLYVSDPTVFLAWVATLADESQETT